MYYSSVQFSEMNHALRPSADIPHGFPPVLCCMQNQFVGIPPRATLSLQLSEKNAFTLSSQTVCVNHKSRSGVAAVAVVLY
jgi:hypothetical protein